MSQREKINFRLEQDSDGYPPFAWEGVWAEAIGEDAFKIDSIPFYIKKISLEDIVSARLSDEGDLQYVVKLKSSSNSTIRIILYDANVKAGVLAEIVSLGCEYEVAVPTNLIAVNVPKSVDSQKLLKYLDGQAELDLLDYEESACRY